MFKLTLFVVLAFTVFTAITAAGGYFPRNIHIAVQGAGSTGLSIQWTTTSFNPDQYTPKISWGNLRDHLPWTVTGTKCKTTTYTEEEFHHTCFLPTLPFSTPFFYRIGSTDESTSDVFQFFTAPHPAAPQRSILLGDLGVENGQNTIDSLMLWTKNPVTGLPYVSQINHCGDIAYSDDGPYRGKANPNFEPLNNKFAEMIQPVAARIPYMVAPGNHDVNQSIMAPEDELPSWGRNFTHYQHRWAMPTRNVPGSSGNMWYSYQIGDTQYIVINTETDHVGAPFNPSTGAVRAGPFGNQVDWLETELRKANLNRIFCPWVIVIGHRPIYSTLTNDFPENQQEKTRAWLEPLFLKFHVDLYVSGHSHLYERSYPMAEGKSVQNDYNHPQAPVYLINGQAGNLEGHPLPGVDILKDLPEWIPFRESLTFGYGLVETFSSMPPKTPNTPTRDNKKGDFMNLDRLHNTTPQGDDFDKFFKEYDTMITDFNDKLPKTVKTKADPQDKCPGNILSMCYSSYPAFDDPRLISEQQYLDRFCILKCPAWFQK